MRAHDTERGNVTVLNSIAGLLLHLRENIADNLGWVVGCLLRARYLETKKKTKYEQERYIERVNQSERRHTSTAT